MQLCEILIIQVNMDVNFPGRRAQVQQLEEIFSGQVLLDDINSALNSVDVGGKDEIIEKATMTLFDMLSQRQQSAAVNKSLSLQQEAQRTASQICVHACPTLLKSNWKFFSCGNSCRVLQENCYSPGQDSDAEKLCLWELLPEELKLCILSRFSPRQLAKAALVSKEFAAHARKQVGKVKVVVIPQGNQPVMDIYRCSYLMWSGYFTCLARVALHAVTRC